MRKNIFKELFINFLCSSVTITIVCINVVIFFSMLFLYKVYNINLISVFSQFHPNHESFRFYQIISSDFVHLSYLHLFNNMILLLFFGISLEYRLKSKGFLFFYLVSGIVSGLIQVYFNPSISSAGASGCLYAVMTFHMLYSCYYFSLLKIDPKVDNLINLGQLTILFVELFLVIIFISNDLYNLNNPLKKIAHHAHLGGAAMGVISFAIFSIYTRFKNPEFKLKSVYFVLDDIEEKPTELCETQTS
jgi:membrane associated rhomboid family serine protease